MKTVMKPLKTASLIYGILAGVAQCCVAQGFINLNFERATGVPTTPGLAFLDWSTAAPGWSHSTGSDTSWVYWWAEHLGTSQYYLLMDASSPYYAPGTQLAGKYSLAFASGHENSADPTSPWVYAFISQTGTIPVGTLSLRMLATGPFQVTVGSVSILMYSLGGNSYGGDISSFAGQTAAVTIMNTATWEHTPTVVDNISFSTIAVPEPSIGAFALSFAFFALATFRRLNTPTQYDHKR